MTDTWSNAVVSQVRAVSGRPAKASTPQEVWAGLSAAVVDHIADDWASTDRTYKAGRMEHYFSAEFLMGRALLNNLSNLGLVEQARTSLNAFGQNLSEVLEEEPDAALGNGGLGRLAACFLDSCATLDLPVYGYGILYRYGLFKQLFENGFQTEHPDSWMEEGYPFIVRRQEEQRLVSYADMTVRAIPYDMPITGYGTKNVNTLRLWKAEPLEEFDYDAFNSQRFTDAIVERERAMDISRVLYPNDTTYEGKVLRVRQQYFFCSASLQDIVANYIERHGTDLTGLSDFNAIQLNDTHPVLAIPELMRILLDNYGMGWEEAWEVVTKTFAYTNHTVLAEALEVGARAYVLKSVHGAEISDVVRAVADGRVLLDERTVTRRRADHDDPTADLTNAERKVLVLIGEGLSNREIGAQLGVAEKTVKNHITSLLAKMGLQRRTQVAAWVASQRASGWRAGSRS